MASSLPAELLLQICRNIKTRNDLLSLLRTCRRFYHIFVPKLYEAIDTNDLRKYYATYLLIKTFLRRPDLAELVHGVDICIGELSVRVAPTVDLFDNGVPMGLEDLISRIMHDEDEGNKWMADLGADYREAWVALLMVQIAPSVRELELYVPDDYRDYVSRIFERAAAHNKPFGDTIPPFPQSLRDLLPEQLEALYLCRCTISTFERIAQPLEKFVSLSKCLRALNIECRKIGDEWIDT